MDWLWAQYKDFAFGMALIFWGSALIGLGKMLVNEPRQTRAKICGLAPSCSHPACGRLHCFASRQAPNPCVERPVQG